MISIYYSSIIQSLSIIDEFGIFYGIIDIDLSEIPQNQCMFLQILSLITLPSKPIKQFHHIDSVNPNTRQKSNLSSII